ANRLGERPDLATRLGEVLVDVRRERLEGRDVDDAHLVRQPAMARALAEELVDRGEEGGERLAGPGGRRDEGVRTPPDGLPAFGLRRGGLAEAALPPALQDGMEIGGEQAVILTRARPFRGPVSFHATVADLERT